MHRSMWSGQHKIWLQYRRDITAATLGDGLFLSAYLRYAALQRLQCHHLEVVDLQRYKLIKKPIGVRRYMKERLHLPFIFPVGKN